MTQVIHSRKSRLDLLDIWNYIAEDSPNAADKFLNLIQEKLQLIASFPLMGENKSEIIDGLRCFPIGNYLVFYFPINDGVEVIRVLHGARDITEELLH